MERSPSAADLIARIEALESEVRELRAANERLATPRASLPTPEEPISRRRLIGRTGAAVAGAAVIGTVAGATPAAAAGLGVTLVTTPWRLYDSRPGSTAPLGRDGILYTGVNRPVQVVGTPPNGGLPPIPGGAAGLLCTITMTDTHAAGFLKAFPSDGPVPGTTVINWFDHGQTIATTTIVRLSAGGAFSLRTGGNVGQILVDVLGYLS